MRYQALLLTGLVLPLATGCPNLFPLPGDENVFDGAGYQLTLPDNAVAIEALRFDAADFARAFEDEDGAPLFIYTLPTQDQLGFAPDIFEGVRYEDADATSTGDRFVRGTLANADAANADEANFPFALARLASGDLLFVLTDFGSESVFDTIVLEDTDGAGIDAGFGLPELLAPPADGVVLLDDGRVFRVVSDDRPLAAEWEAGDQVGEHAGDGLIDPANRFLTAVGDWRSVEAAEVGTSQLVELEQVTENGAVVSLTLSDGRTWAVLFNDEDEARGWDAGDELALIENVPFVLGNAILVRVSTGQLIRVAEL